MVSSLTVLDRVRGCARMGRDAEEHAYPRGLGRVWPLDTGAALAAAELLPSAPTEGRNRAEAG